MKTSTTAKNSGYLFWGILLIIGVSFYLINETQTSTSSTMEQHGSFNGSDSVVSDPGTSQAPKKISDHQEPLGKIALPFSRLIKTAAINDLLVDSRGCLWAATESGVTSVYSDKITHFSINEGTFPFSQAGCLTHDGKTLWVGGLFGICQRTENDRFMVAENSDSLPSQIVYSLAWDGTAIWVGTQNGAAFRGPSGKFQEINESNSNGGLRDNWCKRIVRLSTWFVAAHDKGLSFWNTSFPASNPEWWKNIDHAKSSITRPITDIAFDGKNLWIATAQGVFLLTTPVDKFFSETIASLVSYSRIHGLPANRVNAIIAHKGAIWIGTDEGLARLKDEKVQIVTDENNNTPRRIRKLTASGDILWIGSDRGIQFINTAMVD